MELVLSGIDASQVWHEKHVKHAHLEEVNWWRLICYARRFAIKRIPAHGGKLYHTYVTYEAVSLPWLVGW